MNKLMEKSRKEGKMFILQQLEEQLLYIIIEKYNGNAELSVSGDYDEFPKSMRFSIGSSMDKLKWAGYISAELNCLSNWSVILSPDGLDYFKMKGMRKELFEELPDNAKQILKQLIKYEEISSDISQILREKLESDKTDKVIRSIIGTLKYNGLIKVQWADDTVYYAELTNEGRTYFEREQRYLDRIEKLNKSSINIENFTNTGLINMGNISNSNISIDNSIEQIIKDIDEKADEKDKEELNQIIEEVKDYIDNMKETKRITKNTGLFKRLGNHFEKYQWFYCKVVDLLGKIILMGMGNEIK